MDPRPAGGTWSSVMLFLRTRVSSLYQCQVLASSGSPPLRSSYASLVVTSHPEPPLLTSGPALAVKEATTALVSPT